MLAIKVRGHEPRVVDLSKTKKRGSTIVPYHARWPTRRNGRLRLKSLGGGPVRIDGIAVIRRTN